MNRLWHWLDHRTGIKDLVHEALYERIPGGARWRYVWGSTLVFAFTVQAITGFFLWMCYSASAQTAWESVYYIQHHMLGGWLLRGIHHFTAQAMVVLLVLHLLQVVIDGAYRAPREVNFWLGLVLMKITLGLSLTGYLLPWDQKGYWATRVATNLMGLVPVVGDKLQQLVVGGSDYGHHTLTRFFALHAGLLPALLVGFLGLHIYVFRRHGITTPPSTKPEVMFWPDQVLRDAIACLAVLAVVVFLVVRPVMSAMMSGQSYDVGMAGAELGAPADPSKPYSAARPEWYFLFLFQLLKYFPGHTEIFGAIVLPGLVMTMLFLMPIIGNWKLGHRFNVAFIFGLALGILVLTGAAWHADHRGPGAKDYAKAVEEAEHEAVRAVQLAKSPSGISPLGAVALLRNDPKTQGRLLFQRSCSGCHEKPEAGSVAGAKDAAPTLTGFASRKWITGLLDPKEIAGPKYFGRTKHFEGDMVTYVAGDLQEWRKENPDEVEAVIIALSNEANLLSQAGLDGNSQDKIIKGAELIKSEDRCAQCHRFHDAGELGSAPDLTGYGSRDWMINFVSNPAHQRFYEGDKNDRMPAFAKEPGSNQNLLSRQQIELIVDYIRGQWYEPPHAESDEPPPVVGPPDAPVDPKKKPAKK